MNSDRWYASDNSEHLFSYLMGDPKRQPTLLSDRKLILFLRAVAGMHVFSYEECRPLDPKDRPHVIEYARRLVGAFERYVVFQEERQKRADILRDIFRDPMKKSLPKVLFPKEVLAVAEDVYATQNIHTITELPVLADILQDFDYSNQEVLDHFRSSKFHYRGCWALDYVLGFY